MRELEAVSLRRTIRRKQLRKMVPLADSTIYEMEQRGELPLRFALTPQCIAKTAKSSAYTTWRTG
jgi:prophage regulatory protein